MKPFQSVDKKTGKLRYGGKWLIKFKDYGGTWRRMVGGKTYEEAIEKLEEVKNLVRNNQWVPKNEMYKPEYIIDYWDNVPLGLVPDVAIAKWLNVSVTTVEYHRQKRNIPVFEFKEVLCFCGKKFRPKQYKQMTCCQECYQLRWETEKKEKIPKTRQDIIDLISLTAKLRREINRRYKNG